MRTGPKRLPIVLESHEIEAIKNTFNLRYRCPCRNRAMVELMHRAGLRVSEIVKARRVDIKWEGDPVCIEVRGGKGGKDRTLPLSATCLAVLARWDARRPKKGRTFFCSLKGTPLDARYVERMVKRHAFRAGIENPERVTPHIFRHTFATEAIQHMTPPELQQLLGHASLATTMIYVHVRPSAIASKVLAWQDGEP